MLRRASIPIRQRPHLRCAILLASLLLAIPGDAEDTLSVTEIDPPVADPGADVRLLGCGFGDDAEDLFVWAATADGGFAFVVSSASPTEISGNVGAVASTATGELRVWKGRSHQLADRVLLTQGRLFSTSETRLFFPQEETKGPNFSPLSVSPRTLGSVLLGGNAVIDVDPDPDPNNHQYRIRVSVIIETGGEPGGSSPGTGTVGDLRTTTGLQTTSSSPGLAWGATFLITSNAPLPSGERLALALSNVLEDRFSSLGLTATAQGSSLILGHAWGIQSGFLTLSY